MTDERLREILLIGLEYSHQHEDWVEPLDAVLEGLTVEQALWKLGPDTTSIWEIVLHLAVWNENIVNRVRTRQKSHPQEGAWPPLPEKQTEAEWEHSKKGLRRSIQAVREMIETSSIEQIELSPYGAGDLLCRFIHNGYHIGQIVKIREFQEVR